MKLSIVFVILLSVSFSASAQFSELLKGLEKLTKEFGGSSQQQSEMSSQQLSQPQIDNQITSNSTTSSKLKINSADEILEILPGLWSQECADNKLAKLMINRPHRFELLLTWYSGDGSKVLQRARTIELFSTSKVDLSKNHFQVTTALNEPTGISQLQHRNSNELILVFEIHDTNKFRFFRYVEDGKIRVDNGINLQNNSESKLFNRCNESLIKGPNLEANKLMDTFGILSLLQVVIYESNETQWRFLSSRYGAPPISPKFTQMIKTDIPDIWKQVSPCYKKLTGTEMTRDSIRKFIESGSTKDAREFRTIIQAHELSKGSVRTPRAGADLNEALGAERMTRMVIDKLQKDLNSAKGQNFCEILSEVPKPL